MYLFKHKNDKSLLHNDKHNIRLGWETEIRSDTYNIYNIYIIYIYI